MLVFSSWVCVCVCVFEVHESLSCSVWLGVSGFPEFIVSVSVVGVCWHVCLHICWWISSISRSENQLFFVIVLTLSASFWFVTLNLPNSVQISTRVATKIIVNASLLSSLNHFLRCSLCFEWSICSLFVYLKEELFVYLEKGQPAFAGCRSDPLCWLSREHLPIMTPKPFAWAPYWFRFRFVIFHG